jgi:hypothetical protein
LFQEDNHGVKGPNIRRDDDEEEEEEEQQEEEH